MEGFDCTNEKMTEVPVSNLFGKNYVIREAGGGGGSAYKDAQLKGARINDEGRPVGFSNLAHADLILLSKCMYEVHADGKRTPVTMDFVENVLPNRLALKFIKTAKELSGIEEKADAVKKPQADSEDGSESENSTV
jgi:hypothetical protein